MLIPFGILSASSALPPVIQYLAGYFAGGAGSDGGSGTTTVNKFAFPSDTRSTLATGLSANTARTAGMANSNVAGYVGREDNASATEKFAFADDTRTVLSVGIEFGRNVYAGHANSGVAGYFLGGKRSDNGQGTDRATKLTFATDTTSNLTALEFPTRELAGMANSGVAGYTGGGFRTDASARTAIVRKMAYPGDTNSTLGTGLSIATDQLAGMANSGVAGYFGGGIDTNSFTRTAVVHKFTFPSDTHSTLGTGLSAGRFGLAGMAHSGTAGYFAGGQNAAASVVSTVDKFAFPSDTRTTLGTGLSNNRITLAAMASSGVL
jgi:hypothetical protein